MARALTAMVISVSCLGIAALALGQPSIGGPRPQPPAAQGKEVFGYPPGTASRAENRKEYMRLALATLDDNERAALEKLKSFGFWILPRQGFKFNIVGGKWTLDPPRGIDLCSPPNRYAPPADFPTPTQKDLGPLADLRHVETLSLTGEFITDETLQLLENMEILSELSLVSTRVSDKGLKTLGKLKGVRRVRISGTAINLTPVGMAALAEMPSLENVTLTSQHVTDAGLVALAKNKKLKGVAIIESGRGGSKLTDAPLNAVAGLPQLENLGLPWSKITDQGALKAMQPGNFPSLTGLSLANTSVSDAVLKALHDPTVLPALKQIDVSRTKVTPQGVEALIKARPNLDIRASFPAPAAPVLKR